MTHRRIATWGTRMKNLKLAQLLALLTALLFTACASEPSIRDASESVSIDTAVSGTITAIDPVDRMISLLGEEGNVVVVQAGEQVHNFAQLEVGDTVTLMYHRSVAFDLQPAGSGEAGAYIAQDAARAEEGQKPAGIIGETVTVLAPIVAIDRSANTVSVRGPRGNVQMIDVLKPEYQKQLGKLKIGDLLRITYTEAMAVSVSHSP